MEFFLQMESYVKKPNIVRQTKVKVLWLNLGKIKMNPAEIWIQNYFHIIKSCGHSVPMLLGFSVAYYIVDYSFLLNTLLSYVIYDTPLLIFLFLASLSQSHWVLILLHLESKCWIS